MTDSARPVIVIFGAAVRPDGRPSGALQGRIDAALRLGKRLQHPIYMPTGGQGRHGPPEAEVMAAALGRAGVAPDDIRLEGTGINTLRSALACARLLGRTAAPVYVATSRYHMLRCVLLLRLAGLRARPSAGALGAASRCWRKRWFWRMREIPAIPVDGAAMLLLRALDRRDM